MQAAPAFLDLDAGVDKALAKAVADPVGHYSRADVLRLMFNDTPSGS